MTSHAMQQCCVVGVKHEGTPKGEIKSIGDSPYSCTHICPHMNTR